MILDGKRNDIGSTAEAYARAYLGKVPARGRVPEPSWDADAVTINPYLGSGRGDAVRQGRGARGEGALLPSSGRATPRPASSRTSWPMGSPLYRHVADRPRSAGPAPHRGESGYSLVGAVVGATYPAEMAELRAAMPGVLFLVPGYGTQGRVGGQTSPQPSKNDGLGRHRQQLAGPDLRLLADRHV